MRRIATISRVALLALMLSACGSSGSAETDTYSPGGLGAAGSDAGDSGTGTDARESGAAGAVADGGAEAGAADPRCTEWYQFLTTSCGVGPFDAVEYCRAIDALRVNSGCVAQYEALLSCIDAHHSEWKCNPGFCSSEASTVSDCVLPYCDAHPKECETP